MNPLIVMTTFGRPRETAATLEALVETTDFHQVEIVMVDNGSSDEMVNEIEGWFGKHVLAGAFYPLPTNIGCPAALNFALRCNRARGQAVVKLDNDVRILTPGWVDRVRWKVEKRQARGQAVAMVGAYYDGVLEGRLLETLPMPIAMRGNAPSLHLVFPVIGHCVWHTGAFMDAVGYFDVLADDHLYGFEDLILSHKARAMGWETLVWEMWRIENVQRHSALGQEAQGEHVEKMRPLYDRRCRDLKAGRTVRTGADGKPRGGGGVTGELNLLTEHLPPEE